MLRQKTKKLINQIVMFSLLFNTFYSMPAKADNNPILSGRGQWYFDESNTSVSSTPSTVKYFKFLDSMPDQIVLPIYTNKDMTAMKGKKVFVGYGTVDPHGVTCRVFDGNYTSDGVTKDICLPWWRIEREYQLSASSGNDLTGFLSSIPVFYPPKTVNICKTWDAMEQVSGGHVTCTTYYSRQKSASCYDNPKQSACFQDNCSQNTKQNCTLKGVIQGEVANLTNAYIGDIGKPEARDGKVDVQTYQYECPSGYLPQQKCLERKSALMYPYECKAPSYAGAKDGEYVYCNKDAPIYDATGEITAFPGRCSDGREINCTVNSFNTTSTKCVEPIKESYEQISSLKTEVTRTYVDYNIDVLGGEEDIYAVDPNCLRMNTVKDATEYNSTNNKWEAYKIVTHETGNCGGIVYTNCTNCMINAEQCDFDFQPGGASCGVDEATGQPKFYNWQASDGTTYAVGAQIDEDTYRFSSNPSTLNAALSELGKSASPAYCDIYKIHRKCDDGDTFNGITCIRKYEKRKYRCYAPFAEDANLTTCAKTNETLSQPVSDWTNKTVFTKKTTNYECSAVKERQVGCNKYEVVSNKGQFSLVTDVYYETKDFSGQFVQALATAQMLEQMQHIWSGWHGECEHGTFTDFSFVSDPMFWASIAMSAYASASQGWLGTGAQSAVNDARTAIGASMQSGVNESLKAAINSGALDSAAAADAAFSAADSVNSLGASIVNNATADSLKAGASSWFEAGLSNLASPGTLLSGASMIASALAPISEQEKIMAWNYQQAWSGNYSEDPNAQAYTSCMASIGLAYANIISWSMGADENITGTSIKQPWMNPLRISYQDWNGLQANTGAGTGNYDYVTTKYKVLTSDAIGITLVAITSDAYLQLGQTLCAGYRVSSAMNGLQNMASGAAPNNNGAAMQAMAIQMGIATMGAFCPPCGLAGNIAYKLATAFSDGDACNDEEMALQRSALQYKTNKFQKHDQCHFVKEECSKELNLGIYKKCMTYKKHYCCYDQITTRVFVEGAKEQLGRGWETCNDLYITDLKNIGFRQCGPNESPSANKCLSAAKYSELKSVIMRQASKGLGIDNIEAQVKNSMAVPQ